MNLYSRSRSSLKGSLAWEPSKGSSSRAKVKSGASLPDFEAGLGAESIGEPGGGGWRGAWIWACPGAAAGGAEGLFSKKLGPSPSDGAALTGLGSTALGNLPLSWDRLGSTSDGPSKPSASMGQLARAVRLSLVTPTTSRCPSTSTAARYLLESKAMVPLMVKARPDLDGRPPRASQLMSLRQMRRSARTAMKAPMNFTRLSPCGIKDGKLEEDWGWEESVRGAAKESADWPGAWTKAESPWGAPS